jgi:hypothetical protein
LLFALSGRACLFDLHTETFQEESLACRCAGRTIIRLASARTGRRVSLSIGCRWGSEKAQP